MHRFSFALVLSAIVTSFMSAQIMIDRSNYGLRGTVRECAESTTLDSIPAAEGAAKSKETVLRSDFLFDPDGRLTLQSHRNPDGSEWENRYSYSTSGLLLKTVSGMKGGVQTEIVNEYDGSGRILKTTSAGTSLELATYSYDEQGKKKKVQTSRPEDYRENVASAGSPFSAADHAPNLPGGGTATTFYDALDRPYEIEVRDDTGELTMRVVRTYDEKANIMEETQILPDPIAILPRQSRERILSASGASVEDLRNQLNRLMAGQASRPFGMKYEYDAQGRVTKTHRHIFNREDTVETSYNDHSDPSREVTLLEKTGEPHPEESGYSETVYSYQYDSNGNWTEKVVSYRLKADETFKVTSRTVRTLTYY